MYVTPMSVITRSLRLLLGDRRTKKPRSPNINRIDYTLRKQHPRETRLRRLPHTSVGNANENQCKPSATNRTSIRLVSTSNKIIRHETKEPTTSETLPLPSDERRWSRQWISQRARVVSDSCSYFILQTFSTLPAADMVSWRRDSECRTNHNPARYSSGHTYTCLTRQYLVKI